MRTSSFRRWKQKPRKLKRKYAYLREFSQIISALIPDGDFLHPKAKVKEGPFPENISMKMDLRDLPPFPKEKCEEAYALLDYEVLKFVLENLENDDVQSLDDVIRFISFCGMANSNVQMDIFLHGIVQRIFKNILFIELTGNGIKLMSKLAGDARTRKLLRKTQNYHQVSGKIYDVFFNQHPRIDQTHALRFINYTTDFSSKSNVLRIVKRARELLGLSKESPCFNAEVLVLGEMLLEKNGEMFMLFYEHIGCHPIAITQFREACREKVGVVNPERKQRAVLQCWQCGKEGNLMKCVQCKVAQYCSRKCQKKHWKSNHKSLCKKVK